MKRAVLFFIIISICFAFLFGCIDATQYVNFQNSQNQIQTKIRLTIQKALLEMISSFSDEEINYKEELDIDITDIQGEVPQGFKYNLQQVNTELEYGFLVNIAIPSSIYSKYQFDQNDYFLPRKTENGFYIVLPGTESSDEGDELAAAFLLSSKYKLIISKSGISNIERVSFQDTSMSGEEAIYNTLEFDEFYLIEFPIALWYLCEGNMIIRFYYG